jgi:hypothetical protein
VTLILSDERAFDLIGCIHQLDEHVGEELRNEDEGDEDDGEFDADVSGIRSRLDTGHDVITRALRPRWRPEVVDRPGEQWLVLRRSDLPYYAE